MKYIKKFCLIAAVAGLSILCISSSAAAMTFAAFAYKKASVGQSMDIRAYLDKGYPIDSVDENGMTALCISVQQKDWQAYRLLLQLGANSRHPCMQTMNVKNRIDTKPLSATAVKTADADYTNVYIGAGVLAAGAAAAAILGSGGGGGSSSIYNGGDDKHCSTGEQLVNGVCVPIECPSGTHLEGNTCVPDKSEECPAGQEWNGAACVPIECPTGQEWNGAACVPIECPTGEQLVDGVCVPIECPDDMILIEDTCYPVGCAEGTHLENGVCVPDERECSTGERWNGEACVAIVCPENTHLVGNNCIADDNIDINNETDKDVYGINSPDENVYNLLSVISHPDDEATINLTNVGNGNVYGVFGMGNVANAYVAREDSYGNYNPMPVATGTISITDKGTGSVYGIYSKISDVTQYKEAMNAFGYRKGTAYGNIDITHIGGGASYGVLGDVRAYNGFSEYGGSAYGTITIRGDGDIYGVSGYAAAFNAVSHQFGAGKYACGDVNLYSIGDGDIYGVKVNKEDIPGAGGIAASWFAFNAFASGSDTVEGNIYIHNTGNGNVYGMYGGQLLFNAMSYGTPSGGAKGLIKAVNLGNGNVYGMYMPDIDDSGQLGNINSNQSYSTIELVNTGSGVTTGLRGGDKVSILNSGDILINNLGSGTAVGIYAETGSSVENSGRIHIYRQSFTDDYDDTVYHPQGAVGGTAYGIYAESGVSVRNEAGGEIVISGAANGAGIYLEKGATLENAGTVRFEQVDNSIVEDGEVIDIYQTGDRTLVTGVLGNAGGGSVVLASGGKFFAEQLRGTLGVSEEITLGTFEDRYVEQGALQAEQVDELSVVSKSALFTADVVKSKDSGYDVVLNRRDFAEVLKDKSFAQFLSENYEQQNNAELYDALKKAQTIQELNDIGVNISGADILPNFEREDALVYRRLSRQFNDGLFNRSEDKTIGGYKYIDVSADKDGVLVGSDGYANAAYGMLKTKADNGMVYGIGASIAQLKVDYDNGSERKSNQFGLWLPVGYDFDNGLKWYSMLYAGYADGSYDRVTPLGTRSADYDTYSYGVGNEFRYVADLGKGYRFEPVAELNFLGITQKSFDEGKVASALSAESSSSLSLEGGLGAYLSKNVVFDDDNRLGIQIGGIYYVEFLEPDDGFNATLAGMNGKYRIAQKQDRGRALLSARVSYQYRDVTFYGAIAKETGSNEAVVFDAGIQYKF